MQLRLITPTVRVILGLVGDYPASSCSSTDACSIDPSEFFSYYRRHARQDANSCMMQLRKTQKIGIAGIAVLVCSLLYLFAILPAVMKYQMKKNVALKTGWPMRDMWNKLPFTTEFHVYIFNVTNHLEIGNGAKPIVREVGPFVYDVHQEKIKQTDHEEDDTVSYVPRNLYYFNKYKSNGLSDETEVYFPHLFIITASNGPMKDNPLQVSWTSRAVDTILHEPESLFYKVKAKTALFEGFDIPCGGVVEYFGKTICNEMYDRYFDYTLRKKGDTFYTSMYGFLNDTYDKEKRVRIKRGTKSLADLGKIVELDGRDNISTWRDKECDAFRGTDATIFPPFLNPNGKDDVWLVYPGLCRKLKLSFHSKVKFAGLRLLRYTSDMGTDGDHVPADKCYCIDADRCLRKGMMELYRCTNIPIIASNPHFYTADPYYLSTVDILAPDKDKHMLYIDFDAMSGVPVRVHARIQFNFELFPIEKFRLARNYTYSMLPVIWVDDNMVLPDNLIKDLRNAHLLVALSKAFGYVLAVVGLALISTAGYLEYREYRARPISEKKTIVLRPTRLGEASASASSSIGVEAKQQEARIRRGFRPAPLPRNLD